MVVDDSPFQWVHQGHNRSNSQRVEDTNRCRKSFVVHSEQELLGNYDSTFFRRSETVNFGSDIINCILKAQPIVGCEPAVNVSTPLHLATELTSERKKKTL